MKTRTQHKFPTMWYFFKNGILFLEEIDAIEENDDSRDDTVKGDNNAKLSRVDRIAKSILKMTDKSGTRRLDSSEGKKVKFDDKKKIGDSENDDSEESSDEGESDDDDDGDDDDFKDDTSDDDDDADSVDDNDGEDDNMNDDDDDDSANDEDKVLEPALKEDIYGRLRDAEGNIVREEAVGGRYVPPGRRLQEATGDEKKKVQLERLKKQLKGLVNR